MEHQMSKRQPDESEAYRHRAEVWGFVYETLVKRGMLRLLFERPYLRWDDPIAHHLTPWRTGTLEALFTRTCAALDYRDAHARAIAAEHFQHLALQSFGYGYTLMRALVKTWPINSQLQAVWCPMAWPHDGDRTARDTDRDTAFTQWLETFELPLKDRSWQQSGRAANADMILWQRAGQQDELIVIEYSRDVVAAECAWRDPDDHQQELRRFVSKQRQRGQFAQISSEVIGDAPLQISPRASLFFDALLHQDRPLFKLCQAAAYGTDLVKILQRFERCSAHGQVRAVAVTTSGVESVTARWNRDTHQDARWALLESLGQAYRQYKKARTQHNTPWHRAGAIHTAIEQFVAFLPSSTLREQFKTQCQGVTPCNPVTLQLEETIDGYYRPNQPIALETIHANLAAAVPPDYRQHLNAQLATCATVDPTSVTLRDAHAAAVRAAILNAKPGLNVLALEGNPGIGKTTAMLQLLSTLSGGFVFFYFSPRLVINQEVTQQFVKHGIVTLRTDATIIQHARDWYRYLVAKDWYPPGLPIETAVIVGGAATMDKPPVASILFVLDTWLEELETHAKTRSNRTYRLQQLTENTQRATDVKRLGVFYTLGRAAHLWLQQHPDCQRLALTASIQAHRLTGSITQGTVQQLLDTFAFDMPNTRNNRYPERTRRELQQLAQRLPRWIVMIDEITGDGAGAALVRALHQVMRETLLKPFDDVQEPYPLTLSLVASDASLVNEAVMARYLTTDQAAERIYVAPSSGREAFGVSVRELLGDPQALHVKNNSFPATTLRFEYRLALYPYERDQPQKTIDQRRALAIQTIQSALNHGARQVLYFAQDRQFLADLYDRLQGHGWRIELITSQVKPSKRREILSDQARAQTHVFLMTSSASRGISFPCAEVIIAEVPTFQVEAHFMELAQLIYRGRGTLNFAGEQIDGDQRDRRLVLLLTNTYWQEDATAERNSQQAQAHWLGLMWNLLSAVIVLRATLLTRLLGDAGLSRPLAMIPVGRSAMSDTVRSLFDTAQTAIDALTKLHTDPHLMSNTRALAANLLNRVSHYLSATDLELPPPSKPGQWSPLDASSSLAVRRAIAGLGAPWIPLNDAPNALPLLAEEDECLGPFMKLCRPVLNSREQFIFDHFQGDHEQLKRGLGALIKAAREQGASLQQLHALDDLQHMLQSDNFDLPVRYLLKQSTHETACYWSALPSDWWAIPHGQTDTTDQARIRLPNDPEAMKRQLSQALGLFKPAAIPVIANYKHYPYATHIGLHDPSPLAQSLDEQALACSRELNLINTLLADDML